MCPTATEKVHTDDRTNGTKTHAHTVLSVRIYFYLLKFQYNDHFPFQITHGAMSYSRAEKGDGRCNDEIAPPHVFIQTTHRKN